MLVVTIVRSRKQRAHYYCVGFVVVVWLVGFDFYLPQSLISLCSL